MAKLSLLLILSCILLFQCCLARNVSGGQQQQRQNECQIRSINALEPTYRMQAEAGVTEFWDTYNEQFQCAGVAALRHNIQSRGLLLPSYTNAPLLVYIVQGRGIQGILLPGCPETFQSSQQSQQYEGERGERGQRFRDRHQKIEHFRQGDVLAIQAGAAHWMYNDGNEELVAVVLLDTANNANQLDRNQRRFFLAGNPQSEQQQQGQYHHRPGQLQKQFGTGNVFRGFDIETLTEAFGVDERTARRLQGQEDERGHIVRVEQGLQVIRPPFGHRGRGEDEDEDEEEPNGRDNGIEETICSARVRQNIDNPSRADVYNPRAGRFTSINSFTLPILRYLRLSVQRGVLYRNSIFAPHWYTNCHNVIYVTRGESRIQIVDHSGRAVHDGKVREGQILIVPQNFAVVKQAGERGFEWVGFNTNDNAMINTLSGRTSAMRGLPVDVIANSYQISREKARRMKFSRDQTLIFESRYRSERVASA